MEVSLNRTANAAISNLKPLLYLLAISVDRQGFLDIDS
jgi:hypothetical protein